MPTGSGHALPAIFTAPVRQTPIVFAVYGGPNVYHWNFLAAAVSQERGGSLDQRIGGRLKIGSGQKVGLKINQQQRRFHEQA
jgi:hypothetical protein